MTTYNSFIANYSKELATASKQMLQMQNMHIQKALNEEKLFEILQRMDKIYDSFILKNIERMIFTPYLDIDSEDIANIAFSNLQNTGTEMQMMIYAIDELYFKIKK